MTVNVANKQIYKSVIVVIPPGAAIARGVVADQAAANNFGEGSVAIIPEQVIFGARPIRLPIGYKEVEVTVIVEIGPGATP